MMSNVGDKFSRRSPLGQDFLVGSLTTNSLLDSEEDFREEDVWGNNDGNDELPSDIGAGEAIEPEDAGESTPVQPTGHLKFPPDKVLSERPLGSGPKKKALGLGVVNQGKSTTPSRMIPKNIAALSKDNMPFRRQSAPVNIPDWSRTSKHVKTPSRDLEEKEVETIVQDQGPMIPPHEILAREYSQSVTFSVYSGAGRTLKGRDLNSVRNAVLRQTGFFDG